MKSIKFLLEADVKGINPIKVFSVFLVVSYLLSACAGGAAPTVSAGGDKILARSVVYMGVVENIDDDQWTINGITVTVDPSIVRDGPFGTGDRVKVEAVVNDDGSLTISRLEAVDPGDASTLPQLGDDNSNSNDDNSNDDNANDSNFDDDNGNDANANSNDDGSAANSNDDDSNTNSNDDNANDDDGSNSNDDDDDSNMNSNDDNSNDDDTNSNDDDNNNGSNSNDDDDDDDTNSNDDAED